MRFFHVAHMLGQTPACGDLPTDKEAVFAAVKTAWPSLLESFLIALVGLVDTFMVSSLGSYAIAAVGLTTQPKFIGLAVFLSLNVAVSALVARRRGEEDRISANKVLMESLLITLMLTAVVSAMCVVFADPILRLAGSASDTHHDAVLYFRIIMGGMGFNTITMVINAAQRGAGNTKIALRTNLVSNIVNIVFDYLLIGGHFGFPKLGVAGAAIATVLGTICALLMSIRSVLHSENFICLRIVRAWRFTKATIGSIVNIGSSTFAEQIFLRIGFLVYAMLVARLGTVAFASHQIGINLLTISFSFGDGLSVASIALVGQNLGAKRPDLARIYGKICQKLGLVFSGGLAVVFLSVGKYIFRLFTDEAPILQNGMMITTLLVVIVFLQIPQVVYSGCLRGAGDTKFTAFVSLVSVAIIRPGSGYLLCYPLGLGLFGAWMGIAFDQLMRLLLTWLRFRGGKWMNVKI